MSRILQLSALFISLLCPAFVSAQTQVPKELTVLTLNDVYRLDNLPYVRRVREKLEEQHGEILVLHAGDFLFPSLMSRLYNGAQMIDTLNHLDGDSTAFDPHMFVTFGNHEFDKHKLKHAPMLQQRIRDSQFTWLNSNVNFRVVSPGRKIIQAEQMLPSKLITVNNIKVGLLGIVTDFKTTQYIDSFSPREETVKNTVADLRAQGAEIVIAVTHLSISEDMALLESLGDQAPDMIVGGHEHERQTETINGRLIVKADADAFSVAVVNIDLNDLHGSGIPDTDLHYELLPGEHPADTAMEKLVADWQTKFSLEYCAKLNLEANCLDKPLGGNNVELIAEELTIRRFETNLGNWLTDTALQTFRDQGAQIAVLNSGGMRLNQNLPAGTQISRRHLDALLAYPTRLVLIEITGADLKAMLQHAVSDWTGNGHWLQVAGMAFMHDPNESSASQVRRIHNGQFIPIKDDDKIKVVTNDYLIDNSGDQDGYTMLSPSSLIDPGAKRPDLKDLLIKELAKAEPNGIAPIEDGRICNKANRLKKCILKAD